MLHLLSEKAEAEVTVSLQLSTLIHLKKHIKHLLVHQLAGERRHIQWGQNKAVGEKQSSPSETGNSSSAKGNME